jgi:hypothetical protein
LDDGGFCDVAHIPDDDLVLDVRQAIADFFGVPASKIHPDASLDEFRYPKFEPRLHMYVIGQVLTKRKRDTGSFSFPEQPMKDIQDFIKEIHRILKLSRPT